MDNAPQSALKIEELKEGDPAVWASASWQNKIIRTANAFNLMQVGSGLRFTRSGDKAKLELDGTSGGLEFVAFFASVPRYVTVSGTMGDIVEGEV